MEYYYSIRGDASKHGVASLEDLQQMVAQGKLGPEDLVWRVGSGTNWVPASAVKSLFPEPKPALAAQEPPAVEPTQVSRKPAASAPRSQSKKGSPVGAIVAILAIAGVLGGGVVLWPKIKSAMGTRGDDGGEGAVTTVPTSSTTTTQPVPPVDYEKKFAEASAFIAQKNFKQADPIVIKLLTQDAFRERTMALTSGLEPAAQWEIRSRHLVALIRNGLITSAMAADFAPEIITLNKKDDTVALIDAIMAKPGQLSQDACASAVAMLDALKLPAQTYRILMSLTQQSLESGFQDGIIVGARLLASHEGVDEAITKLTAYLSRNTKAVGARVELAAILASTGNEKRALSELKTAGDENAVLMKQLVQKDTRFDQMRDSWSFKRLMKD